MYESKIILLLSDALQIDMDIYVIFAKFLEKNIIFKNQVVFLQKSKNI